MHRQHQFAAHFDKSFVAAKINRLPIPGGARTGLRQLVARLFTRHTDGQITRDEWLKALRQFWTSTDPDAPGNTLFGRY